MKTGTLLKESSLWIICNQNAGDESSMFPPPQSLSLVQNNGCSITARFMIKDKSSLWWFPNAILSQQLHGKGKMGIHSEVALDSSSAC